MQAINTFCDKICEVCTKRCYQHQISRWTVDTKTAPYLPNELKQRNCLVVCNRCKTHLSSKKNIAPSKSYWNNLDPASIPEVIAELSQAEQRVSSRIIPFVKIIKLSGIFGQYCFQGQAVLFAQDVFEVTENLPNMLPRTTNNAGIVVITERLENINVTRQFSVCRQKVYNALYWLVANNPLYKDVTIDQNVAINEEDIIRVEKASVEIAVETNEEPTGDASAYVEISDSSRIIRASWNQGNDLILTSGFAGVQCCAMTLANILRASILSPQYWSSNILNLNMLTGDQIYSNIRFHMARNLAAYSIEYDQYLLVRNFKVIKDDLVTFGKTFRITFDEEPSIYGSLNDKLNEANLGSTLRQGLEDLFMVHNAGILITDGQSFGVMHYDNKYYFSNSHSCGRKGSRANDNHGKACVIECDTFDEFVRIRKRTTGSKNVQFTLDYVDVEVFEIHDDSKETETHQSTERVAAAAASQMINFQQELTDQIIPLQTSVMAPIDVMQPNVEDEIQVSRNLNDITRKTKDNIVNVDHELKAEEFAWYFLFPYGKNGFKEGRPVKITALDYFQFRILGSDTRFQSNDYLFYALSFFEYYRIKSTILACGKKIVNQEGAVEDVHLYVKNLRGSAAYWRSALNELLAQIRCLGAPTYFLTFSSNDLNWLDQRKALLIADGRPDVDPSTLDIYETQQLIERYPVILSRHFIVRVNALMKFIKNNDEVFGGKVTDHLWRIEFQNRGSPHLHMVVWIENHSEFDTEEGKLLLDRNCCCKIPTEEEDPELYELVKKCQIHRHTQTCTKNNTSVRCRLNFPRQECDETRIVSHSSDDFLRNGGRICLLKRQKEYAWVNNFHPQLLRLWKGNMDIQPCGSNEAIAYYIAKYLSKAEPEGVHSGIAQAIQQKFNAKSLIFPARCSGYV
ncbi:ATP-dependent DNA helicase [Caerostris darwini]|uniref:ATP-dependent DNA helicase n=1 Tax=Caerostris darwini TaxID=1538125 RepID=A0AAV4UI58_9ARAC|nr:ATP-dependent DNA helicase [Caerostris darwini]